MPVQDLTAPAAMDPYRLRFIPPTPFWFISHRSTCRYRNGQLLLEVAECLEQRPLKGAQYAAST